MAQTKYKYRLGQDNDVDVVENNSLATHLIGKI